MPDDKTATAQAGNDAADLRQVVMDLEPDHAVRGDHVGIVVGGYVPGARGSSRRDGGMVRGFVVVAEREPCPELAQAAYLVGIRAPRQEDVRRRSHLSGGPRQAESMVSCGRRYDSRARARPAAGAAGG